MWYNWIYTFVANSIFRNSALIPLSKVWNMHHYSSVVMLVKLDEEMKLNLFWQFNQTYLVKYFFSLCEYLHSNMFVHSK